MGTRPGALDPGVVLYLFQTLGLSAKEVETILYKKSGLLGISGISNDMRDLLGSSEPDARLAVDYFVYRAAKEIGALAAVLGGIDALVFTAGIGENSAEIRRRICEASAWLGIELDGEANGGTATRISTAGSQVSAWVIPTNEELMIARHTGELARTDRGAHRRARPSRSTYDHGERCADSRTRTAPRIAWHGFQHRPLAEGDQRPRLHPAELQAVRRRRSVPRAGDRRARKRIWETLKELFVEERKKGVLDVSQIPSSITAHAPGYIDRENEIIVGLQTDAPLKRAIMPNGGLRMVVSALKTYGYEPDPHVVETFTKYRKTHNEAVFDAYTADIRALPQLAHPDRPARRLRPRPDHRRLPARRALRRGPADRAQAGGEGRARRRACPPTRSSATARS